MPAVRQPHDPVDYGKSEVRSSPVSQGYGKGGLGRCDQDLIPPRYSVGNFRGRPRVRQHSYGASSGLELPRWIKVRDVIGKVQREQRLCSAAVIHEYTRELKARYVCLLALRQAGKSRRTLAESSLKINIIQTPSHLLKVQIEARQQGSRGSTHVAVAANISCLFALVHTLSAAAKSSVKTMMRHIFSALCPVTKYKTAEGPTSRATVVRTRTRRTTISMRRLLYR